MIKTLGTRKDDGLDCSQERQENLAQKEKKMGVKYIRDRQLDTSETH